MENRQSHLVGAWQPQRTIVDLAEDFDFHRKTALSVLRRADVTTRYQHRTPVDLIRANGLIASGPSTAETAASPGIGRSCDITWASNGTVLGVSKSWTVYIDGLNFYSSVRGRPRDKWVDFAEYGSRLLPGGDRLDVVKYFTAQISEKAAENADSPRRQRVFIRAVRATPSVEVYEGKFQVPNAWRAIASIGTWPDRFRPELPSTVVDSDPAHFETHKVRPWKVKVEVPQEKFTDVAIASHLLRDFYIGACTNAIPVTNDADLRPAVELAVSDGHNVGVFSPASTVSRDLARVATWAKSVRLDLASQCQMPDDVPVPDSNRVLSRPRAWK